MSTGHFENLGVFHQRVQVSCSNSLFVCTIERAHVTFSFASNRETMRTSADNPSSRASAANSGHSFNDLTKRLQHLRPILQDIERTIAIAFHSETHSAQCIWEAMILVLLFKLHGTSLYSLKISSHLLLPLYHSFLVLARPGLHRGLKRIRCLSTHSMPTCLENDTKEIVACS